jgi:bifunctional DNase/RNase
MNTEIKLTVAGLVYNQSVAGTYGLVLAEENGKRRFSVMIGEPEAQSIALKMNNKKSPRPLTHDLILTLLSVFGAKIEKVVIYEMVNDVFYSELHLRKNDMSMVVDARTSDAIALSVRAECPVFIKEDIMNVVGMEIETGNPQSDQDDDDMNDEEDDTEVDIDAEQMTEEELDMLEVIHLEELLKLALTEEKYELAVRIRDAIKRRKNASQEA